MNMLTDRTTQGLSQNMLNRDTFVHRQTENMELNESRLRVTLKFYFCQPVLFKNTGCLQKM